MFANETTSQRTISTCQLSFAARLKKPVHDKTKLALSLDANLHSANFSRAQATAPFFFYDRSARQQNHVRSHSESRRLSRRVRNLLLIARGYIFPLGENPNTTVSRLIVRERATWHPVSARHAQTQRNPSADKGTHCSTPNETPARESPPPLAKYFHR